MNIESGKLAERAIAEVVLELATTLSSYSAAELQESRIHMAIQSAISTAIEVDASNTHHSTAGIALPPNASKFHVLTKSAEIGENVPHMFLGGIEESKNFNGSENKKGRNR